MEFTSQICTTKEQSERLLALGLKKQTADMHHYQYTDGGRWNIEARPSIAGYNNRLVPAWSLHRLIEMMPQWIDTIEDSLKLTIDQGKLVCYRRTSTDEVQTFIFGYRSLYDSIIYVIEKLIKEGYFNKEYLEE